MDIGTYDHLDLAARATLSSWTQQAIFAPVTFESTGFPTRIAHIGQIRSLLAGMHGAKRIPTYVEELGGLREDDLSYLKQAVALYVRWYRTVFPSQTGYVPLGDILSQYIAFKKIKALPRHERVLEVGPGYGLTSLFVAQDDSIQTYDMIEIAQPLYIIQSLLYSRCFSDQFCNAAMCMDDPAPFRDFVDPRDGRLKFKFKSEQSFRSTLFPWWMVDVPLSRTYDVIMANANLAEMAGGALAYHLPKWHAALSDAGYLLVQDIGKVTTRSQAEVLARIDAAGFRALAKGLGRFERAFLPFWNLLLVTERHPDYGRAKPLSAAGSFLVNHPVVREVFGVARPPGQMVGIPNIAAHLGISLAAA